MKFSRNGKYLLALTLLCGINEAPAKERTDSSREAAELVQQAYQAEARGNLEQRRKLLDEAATLSQSNKNLLWQQGKVQNGSAWQSLDKIVADADKSNALDTYLKRREQAELTLESQLDLANSCRKLGLKEQERAHWNAILRLNPNHPEALKRMRMVNSNGQLVTLQQQTALKERAAQIAKILRTEERELKSLEHSVRDGKVSAAEAADRLLLKNEGVYIPAWERFVSTPSEAGALAVVTALEQMSDPESAVSLVRHAIYNDSTAVRMAAMNALRTKEEQSYMPQLLASLKGPWFSSVETNFDPSRGVLVFRYSSYSTGAERDSLKVMDDVFYLQGDQSIAAEQAAQRSATQVNTLQERENVRIEAQNKQIMQVLASVTKEQGPQTPEDWWQWWDQRNQSYKPGSQQVSKSYGYQTGSSYGQTPLPAVFSQTPRHECLAGGTKVLTNRGPMAVDRIRPGDLVLARSPHTGETAMKPVLLNTQRAPEALWKISLGDQTIRASAGHPFWVSGKGWVISKDLKEGMVLHGLSEPVVISKIEEEKKPSRSFNLIVDEFHSYFVEVGDKRIFSHDNTTREPIRTTVPGMVADAVE